ncbi:MAG TPA: hypothetical protein VNO81_04845 [Candidatus Nitrosotenuis sp.]|nr:hypothetical protein [Candidatus Nitrosotenuis sp.]
MDTGARPAARRARPTTVLSGESAQVYLAMLRRLLEGGRLNRFYPDPRALDNLYRMLARRPSLEVDLHTGLPNEPMVGGILAEQEAAERFLAGIDGPGLAARQDEAARRLAEQVAYYQELRGLTLPRRSHMEMWLRKVDQQRRRAYFMVVFERFDPGEGLFTRYTVQLSQQHGRWSRPQVELKGDDLEATTAFRDVISRYHSDEAEFAFILLSEVPHIEVEEVVRCRVGPLWFGGIYMPPEVDQLLARHPGSFLLHLPCERASRSLKQDLNQDPFALMYRDSLPEAQARELAEAKARQLGYRVFKERKFCCTRSLAEPFKEFLAARGQRCVVYGV